MSSSKVGASFAALGVRQVLRHKVAKHFELTMGDASLSWTRKQGVTDAEAATSRSSGQSGEVISARLR